MPNVQLKYFGDMDVGRVRSANQDNILMQPEAQIFAVADGMGGHAGGEIASEICVKVINDHLIEKSAFDDGDESIIKKDLMDAINRASTEIYEKALENPELKGMGTTATAAVVKGKRLFVGHVGDSRLYVIRCGFIYQITADHSLVSEQVRAGIITEEEAEEHQLRNVITRSVGYQEVEDVDVYSFELQKDDLILICSDGLYGKVRNREISLIAEKHGIQSVQPLIDLANERGGEDNISVIVIKIQAIE